MQPEHRPALWDTVEPLLQKAVDRSDGLLTIDGVKDAILSGRWQLWIVWDGETICAAGATEVNNYTCFVWAFGGENMSDWFPLHQELEAWAKLIGCKSIHFFGRLGWERVMRPEGYERRMVVMRKEL